MAHNWAVITDDICRVREIGDEQALVVWPFDDVDRAVLVYSLDRVRYCEPPN